MPRSYNKMDDTDPLAANESLVFTIRCYICKPYSLNSSLISSYSSCCLNVLCTRILTWVTLVAQLTSYCIHRIFYEFLFLKIRPENFSLRIEAR